MLLGFLLWFEMELTFFVISWFNFLRILVLAYLFFSHIFQICSTTPFHCLQALLQQLLPMSSIWAVFLNYLMLPVIFLSTFLSFLSKCSMFSTCLCLQSPTNCRCSINVLMRLMITNTKSRLHQFAPHSQHREIRMTRNLQS